jgi:hypothetical protein
MVLFALKIVKDAAQEASMAESLSSKLLSYSDPKALLTKDNLKH